MTNSKVHMPGQELKAPWALGSCSQLCGVMVLNRMILHRLLFEFLVYSTTYLPRTMKISDPLSPFF